MKRDSFRCQYCGASAPEALLQVDHIKPTAEGGCDDLWNLVTSCQPCNSGKSDRPLSDHATVIKAKKQLDDLQVRREQLEMLMDWHCGLTNLQEEVIDEVAALYSRTLRDQYRVNEQGRLELGKLIAKYSVEAVVAAMAQAKRYLECDSEGLITEESAGVFFSKIGAICEVDKRSGGNEEIKEIYYIRGIVRKRISENSSTGYFDYTQCFELLESAISLGVTVDQLRHCAKKANNWSRWRDEMVGLIEEARSA